MTLPSFDVVKFRTSPEIAAFFVEWDKLSSKADIKRLRKAFLARLRERFSDPDWKRPGGFRYVTHSSDECLQGRSRNSILDVLTGKFRHDNAWDVTLDNLPEEQARAIILSRLTKVSNPDKIPDYLTYHLKHLGELRRTAHIFGSPN